MKILKIIHGYPPLYNAGSEVYSQSVCEELSRQHKVSVFTREENLYAPDFSIRHERKRPNLDLYIVNNPQGKDGYCHRAMDSAFAQLLDSIRPDVAYVGHVNHLSTGLVEVLRSRHIPIVYMLHDYWLMCPRGQFLTRSIGRDDDFQLCARQEDGKCARDCYAVYFSGTDSQGIDEAAWADWVRRRMETTRSFVEKVDLFIAPSQYLRNRFIRDFGIPQDKIIYLDYGFPVHYLHPPVTPIHNKPFVFGYIGTHIPAKGVNMLIDAFKKIEVPATLKIFGRDNGQSTASLKRKCVDAANPIMFMGEYQNENVASEVFAQVDCIVVPSIWAENSPLVIHEAQECRIPVITADYGGMAEYVHHHVNGLLFRHRDTQSLYEQMSWAVQHPVELQSFGQRGYLYSPDGHVPSIQEHCQQLINIFQDVVRK